jgi:hypothetical protein
MEKWYKEQLFHNCSVFDDLLLLILQEISHEKKYVTDFWIRMWSLFVKTEYW